LNEKGATFFHYLCRKLVTKNGLIMKNIVVFLCLCFLCGQPLFGQQTDTLVMKRNKVFLNDSQLNHKELQKILGTDTNAKKSMARATAHSNSASVFGLIGGFCIGCGVITGLHGKNHGWIVAGVGASLVYLSVLFTTAYNKHVRNAVGIYNARNRPATLQIGTFSSGVGVKIAF
jgi:hypothetical protein